MGTNHLFYFHRHQIAVEHGRWHHQVFGQGNGCELERKAARRPHSAFHRFRDRPQVEVTVVELAPGVANADDGFVFERAGSKTFSPKGYAVIEPDLIIPIEPSSTAPIICHWGGSYLLPSH
jgi:hypothetical protein